MLSLATILIYVTRHLAIVLISASYSRLLYLRLLRLRLDGFPHILLDKVFLILWFKLAAVFTIWNTFFLLGRFYRSWYVLFLRGDYLPTCINSSLILLNTTGPHARPGIARSRYRWMTSLRKGLGRQLRRTHIITIVLDNQWRLLLKVIDTLCFRDVVIIHRVAQSRSGRAADP